MEIPGFYPIFGNLLEIRQVYVIEGNARNVELKILWSIWKGLKIIFFKTQFKIFHNNIVIFQPYIGLKKLSKIYILKILLRKHK